MRAVSAGLPEIYGSLLGFYANGSANDGSLWFTDENNIPGTAGSNNGVRRTIKFNASLSNAIYGNSTTVQPPALQLIPQIRY